MSKTGLVLGGGGARGAYHIGAWKAFRELKMDFDIISGASVGAINGALMLQGDINKAVSLWESVEIKSIAKIQTCSSPQGDFFTSRRVYQFLKEMVWNFGIDLTPLKEMMEWELDEDKIRTASTDLILTIVSVLDLSPVQININEIPKGELVDYLLASARFIGIKGGKINKKVYLDGGVYDNIPIKILKKNNVRRIVVVDTSGLIKGILHRKDIACETLTCIRPINIMEYGELFDFSRERILRNINMGYLDTLKAFEKLDGQYFYFKPEEYYKLKAIYGFKTLTLMEKIAYKVYKNDRIKVLSTDEFLEMFTNNYEFYQTEYYNNKEFFAKHRIWDIVNTEKRSAIKINSAMIVHFMHNCLLEQDYKNKLFVSMKQIFKKEYEYAIALLHWKNGIKFD